MTLIKCCESCVYQKDGMCCLDHVSGVTNLSHTGCIHRLIMPGVSQPECMKAAPLSDSVSVQEPPPHHGSF